MEPTHTHTHSKEGKYKMMLQDELEQYQAFELENRLSCIVVTLLSG